VGEPFAVARPGGQPQPVERRTTEVHTLEIAEAVPDPVDAGLVTHVVLGQRVLPAHDQTLGRGRPDPGGPAHLGVDAFGQGVVVEVQRPRSSTRPTLARSTNRSRVAWCGHFRDVQVTAFTSRPSERGTRNPLPSGTSTATSRS
jgi:hypothetical protein